MLVQSSNPENPDSDNGRVSVQNKFVMYSTFWFSNAFTRSGVIEWAYQIMTRTDFEVFEAKKNSMHPKDGCESFFLTVWFLSFNAARMMSARK
jgi:hypothetical protein